MTTREKYSDDELARLGAQGHAFKNEDGSYAYPIANEEDLVTVIEEVGRGGAEFDAVRTYVMARARDLGLSHRIPANWHPDGSLGTTGGTTDGRAGHPRTSLVRGWGGEQAIGLRDGDGNVSADGNVLTGMFSVFNRWTEINSPFEGHFMERIARGSFDGSLAKRQPKVLFNHGKDPSIGNKALGIPSVIEAREEGQHYEVPLFDTSYNRDLKPGLAAGAYGASFRFGVDEDGDEWIDRPSRSEHNPNGIPEVTRTKLDLYEFGPVTFGQYPEATSGLRSLTDEFVEQMLRDPLFLARLVERAGLKNIEPLIESARGAAGADEEREQEQDPDSGGAADEIERDLSERRRYLARLL